MTDEAVAGHPDGAAGHSNRPGLYAGVAVGLVLCAIVGAIGGFLLAGDGTGRRDQQVGSGPTTSAVESPSQTSQAATPSRTPSRPSSSTPPPIGQMVLPDLVGMDFEEAREELRRRGLGAQLVFGRAGSERSVASTNPRAGTTVKKGITVRVTVVGAPPEVVVPDLVGQSCRQAARRLGDDGLYPSYPTDNKGEVRSQEPVGGTVLRWNDRVALYCSDSAEPPVTPTQY